MCRGRLSTTNGIFSKLETADIILLLVSSDFISSPYCYSREMMRAMERHETGEARVIPVILRHCLWQGAPFGKLMVAPRDGKPVTSWPDRDEALADVAGQVAKAVEALGSGASTAHMAGRASAKGVPPEDVVSALRPKPRSSNLRLKREFTEKDRDHFLRATFEFVCKFFEGSVEAIGERNADVTGTFDRIDSRRMAAILYRSGKKVAECSVRLGGLRGRSDGIAFSHDASTHQSSFNEMLSVEATEQALFLKPIGMSWSGSERDKHLSQEGAAEFLWDLFIGDAQ